MSDVLGLVIIAMIVVISLYAIYRISENLKRLDSKQKFDSKSALARYKTDPNHHPQGENASFRL